MQSSAAYLRQEASLLAESSRSIFASDAEYMAFAVRLAPTLAGGQYYVGELRFIRANGDVFWGRLRVAHLDVADGAAGQIWTLADISDQMAIREQLEWAASHDMLTGLANRKVLEDRMTKVLDALPRSVPSAVMLIDLDHFKPINDGAGHAAGDAMLKAVASAISTSVRAGDLVVRIGGDEFGVLLERCPREAAMRIAESIRIAVTAIALPWDGSVLSLGASVGVAMLSPETGTTAAWLQAADAACYTVKRSGRGAVSAGSR